MTIETPGIKALRRLQFGREVTPGTGVLPTAMWRGEGVLKTEAPVEFPPEDVGSISGLDRSYNAWVGATMAIAPTPATFEQLCYLLSMGIKLVQTGAADGAGTGKIYTYPLPTTSRNTIRTSTMEGGDDHQMETSTHVFAEEITLTSKAKEAWMVSANLRGKKPTVNTLTASTIAFVEGTKKITDSGNGLAGFLTGMRIKVTGTTNNDGTYTVATGGVAAEIRFASSPGALKPFVLEVAAPEAKAVAATFAMVGMDMGENRYQLVRTDAGPWRASVILPVCVAGRADWLMTLEVDNRRVAVPFVMAGRP
jgi:hypothetical protein